METSQAASSTDPPADAAAAEVTQPAPPSPSPSTPTIALPPPSPSSTVAPSSSSSHPQSQEQQHQSQSHSHLQSIQLQRGPAARTRSQTQLALSSFPPAPTSSSSSSSSSASAQRSGLVIGVPAIRPHHARPPLPVGHSFPSPSSFGQPFTSSGAPSPSLSQPLGSFSRGSLSMPEKSPGPPISLGQPFSGIPRSSPGMPEQQPNSGSQLRPSIPGVQTIGMIGASPVRASGVQHLQRLGQPNIRTTVPSDTNQSLNTQKLSTPGLSRPASISSSTASLTAPHNAQSLQQQWMSNQGKQTHLTSIPSYRPQMKQSILQQRPQSQYQQQQNSPSVTSSQLQISSSSQQQQHQKQQSPLPEQQIMSMQSSELHKNQQPLPQQQPQPARVLGSTTQRSNIPLAQPVSGTAIPVTADGAENCNNILSKRSIREILAQIDPSEKLEPDVEDVLVEIAEDFVESITTAACSLAKHRQSNALEAKDILLHVERSWNMTFPGFGGDEIKFYKKPYTNDIHKERLSVIRKSMGIATDGGNIKSNAAGQAAANSKAQTGKASGAAASGSPKGI
ncbi:hypothetical protein AXF42_Ash000844 [Apostasia shenzhenica]|uniref:Transcription initiation factor TFIID subunit 12 domain-containing protein n=1 Tax=Apostasia shenzhenica TaxID=1088818 RepID=A0A2I0AT72_9ASPA|nr:hypothetical protein AXF42_Ash000844 [Apostasia shenzhenica]